MKIMLTPKEGSVKSNKHQYIMSIICQKVKQLGQKMSCYKVPSYKLTVGIINMLLLEKNPQAKKSLEIILNKTRTFHINDFSLGQLTSYKKR